MKNNLYKLTALLWEIKWRGRFLRCFHGSTWKNDCLLANAGPTILECVVLKCCDRLAAAYQEPLPINMENPTTGRKIWIFLYCVKKTISVNYFFEVYFQTSSESSKYRSINQNGPWNLCKIAHFQQASTERSKLAWISNSQSL